MTVRSLILVLALLFAPSLAQAVQPDEVLADPVLETRARAISEGLRCLVCQNQSIDDSAAPLARDLRLLVRERLKSGDTDEAVRDYLVARYGDFVLLKPPFKLDTALLWTAPFLVLIVGAGLILMRRRIVLPPGAVLSPEEQARIEAIMDNNPAA